jgi:hypothetical protein
VLGLGLRRWGAVLLSIPIGGASRSQAACVEAPGLRPPDLDPAGASGAAVATMLGEGRWRQREEGRQRELASVVEGDPASGEKRTHGGGRLHTGRPTHGVNAGAARVGDVGRQRLQSDKREEGRWAAGLHAGQLGRTYNCWATRMTGHRRSYGICLISTISVTERDRTWLISVVVDHPLFTTPPALVLH